MSNPAKDPCPTKRQCIVTGEILPKWQLLRFVMGPDGKLYCDYLNKLPGRGVWVKAERHILQQAVAKKRFVSITKKSVTLSLGIHNPQDMEAWLDGIKQNLQSRITQSIQLARRAGMVTHGYDQVQKAIQPKIKQILQEKHQYDCKNPQDGALSPNKHKFGHDFLYLIANDAGKDAVNKIQAKMKGVAFIDGVDGLMLETISKPISEHRAFQAQEPTGMFSDLMDKTWLASLFAKQNDDKPVIHCLISDGGLLTTIRKDIFRFAGFI